LAAVVIVFFLLLAQVAFMLFDQLHCPIKASPYVQEVLQQVMRATTSVTVSPAHSFLGCTLQAMHCHQTAQHYTLT
jgi:hypothetical protein